MATLGEKVRALRKRLRISQKELASRIVPRVTQQSIDALERGEVQNPRNIVGLAKALGVTAEELQLKPMWEPGREYVDEGEGTPAKAPAHPDTSFGEADLFGHIVEALDALYRSEGISVSARELGEAAFMLREQLSGVSEDLREQREALPEEIAERRKFLREHRAQIIMGRGSSR